MRNDPEVALQSPLSNLLKQCPSLLPSQQVPGMCYLL